MDDEPLSPLEIFLQEVRERPAPVEELRVELRLGSQHEPTGRTRHYRGDVELPAPTKLAIVRYVDDVGYYLFYYDSAGEAMTDTWHQTLPDAIAQAAFEFGVRNEEWGVDRATLAAEFDAFIKVPFPRLESDDDELGEMKADLVADDTNAAGSIASLIAGAQVQLPPARDAYAGKRERLQTLATSSDPHVAHDASALLRYVAWLEALADLAAFVTD